MASRPQTGTHGTLPMSSVITVSLQQIYMLMETSTARKPAIVVCSPHGCTWLFDWKPNARGRSGPRCQPVGGVIF